MYICKEKEGVSTLLQGLVLRHLKERVLIAENSFLYSVFNDPKQMISPVLRSKRMALLPLNPTLTLSPSL